jgi:hypothetical protein
MTVPRSSKPTRKRRYIFHMFFAATLTTVMVATGGFGILSGNSLTDAFQNVIGENFPLELLNPFNAFMENLSAPQIPLAPDSNPNKVSPPDPVGAILSLFADDSTATDEPFFIEATITSLAQTQTQVAVIQSRTATATQVQTHTQTAIPSITFTLPPTATLSPIPTWTFQPIYLPPTATDRPEPKPTFTFTNTPTPVPNHLVLYLGGVSEGNIGPRNTGDAFCAANLPAGFSNYRVFIGYSSSDSISNMASNYGIPTSLPIQSVTNVVIANDWADLMDGTIDVALSAAGVLSPGDWWWSGSEDGFGTHIDGTTANCTGWTSNNGADPGIAGYHGDPNSSWLRDTIAGCGDPLAVLCIAY